MDITADLDALRVLARALVLGDPDADDLVQDTVLAALEHPPSSDRPLRPWLATVLRNRRRFVHRAAVRRAARERAVAAPEPVAPAADEMIARARMLERLAAALVALDEPFRQTIILHYLDGRSAADIARTLGVPAGTVRWRLKTGLDRLRAALDRDAPRARWQVALATGVIVKTKTTWLGVILLVLVAAMVVGWFVRGRGSPPPEHARSSVGSPGAPTGVVRRAADPAPSPAEAPPADPLPGQGRAAVEDTAEAGGAFAGRVINWSTGEGVAGTELTFSGPTGVVTVRSGAAGEFELASPSPTTYVLVAADAEGFLPYAPEWQHSSVRLASRSGKRVRGLTVFLFPALEYRGQVVDAAGAPVAGAKVRLLGSPAGEQALAGPVTRWVSDRAGRFTFHAPDGALFEATARGGRGRAVLDGDVALTHELLIRIGVGAREHAAIRGKVVDGDGIGEPGVLVRAAPMPAPGAASDDLALRVNAFATTGEGGWFTLSGVDRQLYRVSAEAEDRAPAAQEGVSGGTSNLVLVLEDGSTLAGMVEGAGGPVPSFTLLVHRADGAVRELVTARSVVDAAGAFSVRVPEGNYELIAASPGWAPSAPTEARPGAPVTLRLGEGATLAGRVVSAQDGAPLEYARIMREARGGGASAQPANAGTVSRGDGTFELTGIPAGAVSIMIGAGGHHPRIESGLVAADGAVLGPIEVRLRPLAEGERPQLELVGIGVKLAAAPDGLLVEGLVDGGGAAAAGVVPGDRVIAVDGEPVDRLGMDGAIARIRGAAGTWVRITLARPGGPVELAIERKPIRS